MNYAKKVAGLIVLTCLIGSICAVEVAAAQSTKNQAGISLDFKDIELRDLIKTIAEMTGRNFVYDERVRGKVTIISPSTMSKEEAYQLFLTVLNVKGFTLVESGRVNKIVPLQTARQNNLPVSDEQKGESYVTRLIQLDNADAQALASSVLMPLIPKTSNLTVYLPTNTLIITDSAANIERLIKIIKLLDVPSSLNHFEVFKLKRADADEIAKIANSLLTKQANPQRKRGGRNNAQPGQVIAYPRTNTLLAVASTEEINLLRNLIETLDTPSDQNRSNINVYYLKNADAETLAKTLNEIMTGAKAAAPGKRSGATSGKVFITADKPTNSLLISAAPEDLALVKQVIEKLDIRRNQVYVEALILELSMNATREIGASLQGAVGINGQSVLLGSSNLNTGSVGLSGLVPDSTSTSLPSLLTQTIKGLMIGGLFDPITTIVDGKTVTVPALSALIQLSETSKDINILSAPRLLTSDNEEAEIIVGANVPIITSRLTDSGGSSSLAQSVSIERKDVALTLRFTPQVTEGNLVRLTIFQEITAISGVQIGNVDSVGPTFTKRQLRNTVLAEDGKTVVLGGLIGTNVQKTESKVPILGDIPLLGRLFRSTATTSEKTNLLVFITPRVIHNASEMAAITRHAQLTGQSLQTRELRDAVIQKKLLIETKTEVDSIQQEVPSHDE
ncbi:MAG: type II secretion system secretin GspD [Geopsychrobacter sp.]|nr:type II secretion system secretin GspD [Geopsychrobacter sp.]